MIEFFADLTTKLEENKYDYVIIMDNASYHVNFEAKNYLQNYGAKMTLLISSGKTVNIENNNN